MDYTFVYWHLIQTIDSQECGGHLEIWNPIPKKKQFQVILQKITYFTLSRSVNFILFTFIFLRISLELLLVFANDQKDLDQLEAFIPLIGSRTT